MTKKEIKKSSNEDLLVDYICTYASYICNLNLQRGTIAYGKHLEDLQQEILERGILSQKSIDYLNR